MKQFLTIALLFITNVTFSQSFDITPFPGEEKPNKVISKRDVLAGPTNWGEDLLLPEELITRLTTECKNKVVVKVFDTASKYDHNDLKDGQLTGSNFTSPQGSLVDVQGHSTHVAGIIASKNLGLARSLVQAGVLQFKPVKVLNDQGAGSFDWVANAVKTEDLENKNYLNQGTFVVVNMSLGGGTAKYAPTESALKLSKELGVIYCIAAGNTGTLGVNYPGNSEHVIGVGSLDQNLKRSSFSTFGPEVWMSEPGRGITSTYLNQQYASLSGTSMATPFQSALCAISLSKWGKVLANTDVMKKYMAWVASDILPTGKDNETGYGYAFVKSILDKNPKDIPTGGPVNPPTPPVNPPTHTVRDLSFTLNVNYSIGWSIVGNGSTKNKEAVLLNNVDLAAGEITTITKIDIVSYKTTLFAADELKKLNTEITEFFTNRGLGLLPGSDYADATYWTAYFLDLILKSQKNYDIDVLRIEGKDQKGNTIMFTKEGLKKF
jgi:subtilisin family serine protease